ncbi:hypothetical protein AAY473_028045 [Plecturocebus cupreus]
MVVHWELRVNRGSFVNPREERCAGYTVVTLDTEIKSIMWGAVQRKRTFSKQKVERMNSLGKCARKQN